MPRPLMLLTALSFLASAAVSSGDAFNDSKETAKKKFLEADPDSLTPAKIEELKLKPEDPGANAVTITIGEVEIRMPAPTKREDGKAAIALTYPDFTVIVANKAFNYNGYASLPAAWGKTELEKSFHICSASGKTIDDATTPTELDDAVALLTARNTIAPIGGEKRAVLVTAPHYKGLILGTMARDSNPGKRSSSTMNLQTDPPNGKAYKIVFSRKEGDTTDEAVKAFIPKIGVTVKKAE